MFQVRGSMIDFDVNNFFFKFKMFLNRLCVRNGFVLKFNMYQRRFLIVSLKELMQNLKCFRGGNKIKNNLFNME